MIDLYKYKDILTLINMSITISIPLMSILFYMIFKNKSFIIMFLLFLLEIIINLFIPTMNNIKIMPVNIAFILKLGILILISSKIDLKKYSTLFMSVIICITLLAIGRKYEYSIIGNTILNIIILKKFIMDRVKMLGIELINNKQKLKMDKEFIQYSDNKILIEYELQNNYKNEILNINNKINKSMEESDTPIFILNINKEFIYSNNAFKKIIAEDEINPDDFEILTYLQHKFSESHQVINIIKNINKEMYKNINIKSNDGKIYRFICVTDIIEKQNIIICILNDITKTTIIQNKLKESEERYKNLMDILNEGVIIHNGNDISYANSKALDLFDLQDLNKSMSIENIKNKISRKFKKDFLNNINLIKSGEKERALTKVETDKGKVIEFITTTLGLNELDMFLSIAIDITDLENAITSIEQSEKMYKLLLHTLPEGIIIIDKKQKKHIYRNESIMEILKNVGVEKINDIVKTYLAQFEYGEFKKFTIDAKNNIDISVAIIERKEDDTLVVVVRTLDYEYKSKKMQKEFKEISNKTKFKTDFLYNIVNDIRSPIYNIFDVNNNLYKNRNKYKSQYIENYTRLLKQNCYRLIRLSNNIKEIREIENGKSKLKLERCDLVKLINQIVNSAKLYTDEKGISIYFNSNVKKKVVAIDVEKIEKIVLNILSNAIKFTDKDGRIDINVECIGEKINISIKDTGIGIPEDKIDDIFNSFEQVDRTLSRGAEGTGMGLYLVKKISEVHNIEINVDSKLHSGSQFKLVLNDFSKDNQIKIDNALYSISENSEKVDIEFADIYFDISS